MNLGLLPTLSNKVALVTGASTGIGRHFALTLAQAGPMLSWLAGAGTFRRRCKNNPDQGRNAYLLPLDVTDCNAIKQAIPKAWSLSGKLIFL